MKKLKIIIPALLMIVSGIIFACSKKGVITEDIIPLKQEMPETQNTAEEPEEAMPDTGERIMVHICGAVLHPDVYEADPGDRVIDAVRLAGGFTKEAAADSLNLAEPLRDGSRIYIPTYCEIESGTAQGADYLYGTDSTHITRKVNINTADAEQLMTLSGIGETRARDIITYREKNGAFGTIEDIKKVPGIKESVFSKISDDIEV